MIHSGPTAGLGRRRKNSSKTGKFSSLFSSHQPRLCRGLARSLPVLELEVQCRVSPPGDLRGP